MSLSYIDLEKKRGSEELNLLSCLKAAEKALGISDTDSYKSEDVNSQGTNSWLEMFEKMSMEEIRKTVKEFAEFTSKSQIGRSALYFPGITNLISMSCSEVNPDSILINGDLFGLISYNAHSLYKEASIVSVAFPGEYEEIQKRFFRVMEIPGIVLSNAEFEKDGGLYDLIVILPPFGVRTTGSHLVETFNGVEIKLPALEWRMVNRAISHMNKAGKLAVLVPKGTLFSIASQGFRKILVNENLVEKVIGLPSGLLYGTGVVSGLVVLSKNKLPSIEMFDYGNIKLPRRIAGDNPIELFTQNLKTFEKDNESYWTETSKENIELNEFKLDPSFYLGSARGKVYENTAELNSVAEIIRGKVIKSNSCNAGGCLLASDNSIDNQSLNYSKLNEIDDIPEKYSSIYVKDDDILLFNKGVKPQIALVKDLGNRKVIANSNLIIIRSDQNKISPEYLMAYLISEDGQNHLDAISQGGVIKNITTSALKALAIPMVDLEHQEVLGNRYSIIQSKIRNLKKEIQELEEKRDSLFDEGGESLGVR